MTALHMTLVAVLATQLSAALPTDFDLDASRRKITTANPVAQRNFDRGLQFMYGSEYSRAIEAFRTARSIDPSCAMCYWGEALALGPNVHGAMTAENDSAAQDAMRKAVLHAARVTSPERAYIRALARRYGSYAVATRQTRDSAYARAMNEIVRAFPEDDDAALLHAEAQLLLAFGNHTGEGSPGARDNVLAAVRSLDEVLGRTPNHPGACRLLPYARAAGDADARLTAQHECKGF